VSRSRAASILVVQKHRRAGACDEAARSITPCNPAHSSNRWLQDSMALAGRTPRTRVVRCAGSLLCDSEIQNGALPTRHAACQKRKGRTRVLARKVYGAQQKINKGADGYA